MLHAALRASAWALLALEASCLGERPSCSESAIYEGWPKTKWDELYAEGRPQPNYAGCTTVDLEGADLEADEVMRLCSSMASNATHMQGLTALSFNGIPLSAGAHGAVAQLLQASTTLTSLSLGSVALDADSAASLVAALRSHVSLQRIDLEWNHLDDAGAALVGAAVAAVGSVLRSLGLARNAISDAGAAALSAFGGLIRSSATLTSLRLEGNEIGAAGAASLAEALRFNTRLTNLGLELNPVGPQGGQELSTMLLTNSHLADLGISDAELGDEGITALAAALRANSALRALRLERNGITDAGAAELAEMLRVNSGLQVLDLRQNRLGAAAARAFAKSLLDNTVILEIRLAGNYRLPGLGRVGEGEPEIPPELMTEIETLLARNRELRGATLSPHGWSAGTWAGTFVEGEYVGPHALARTWKQEL